MLGLISPILDGLAIGNAAVEEYWLKGSLADRIGAGCTISGPEGDSASNINQTYPTWLIDLTLYTIGLADAASGIGKPQDGQELIQASDTLQQSLQTLESAQPETTHWSSRAAQDYLTTLTTLRTQAAALSELDQQMQTNLETHSQQIQKFHIHNGYYITILFGSKVLVRQLIKLGRFSSAWAIGTFIPTGILLAFMAELGFRQLDSVQAADDSEETIDAYRSLNAAARFSGKPLAPAQLTAAEYTSIKDFSGTRTTGTIHTYGSVAEPATTERDQIPHISAATAQPTTANITVPVTTTPATTAKTTTPTITTATNPTRSTSPKPIHTSAPTISTPQTTAPTSQTPAQQSTAAAGPTSAGPAPATPAAAQQSENTPKHHS